jgi:CheY-like chemotaxis protein
MRAIATEVQPIRVLLVEDESLINEWVTESLEEQGFAVHAVANAADALRHLDEALVDVLFTDINLPGGVDGITLARRARELLPELPVVYASGGVNVLDPQVRVPRSTFVPKPYIPALIGCVLANAVKERATPLPARSAIARSRHAQETLRASGCDNRRQ